MSIDNPANRNSITREMWQTIPQIVSDLARDDTVRVLVLRGEGTDFSAGVDIADLDAVLIEGTPGSGGLVSPAEEALAHFPKPTLAAIDGYCVGGGWELAAACDIRLASTRSVFGVTPARLGILYPLSGLKRLVQIAGPAAARHLIISGELVDADTAARWGMVSRTIPAEHLRNQVEEFAASIAARSQLTQTASKQLIDLIVTHDDALAHSALNWERVARSSDDRRIGVDAFLSKATPHFTWRSEN